MARTLLTNEQQLNHIRAEVTGHNFTQPLPRGLDEFPFKHLSFAYHYPQMTQEGNSSHSRDADKQMSGSDCACDNNSAVVKKGQCTCCNSSANMLDELSTALGMAGQNPKKIKCWHHSNELSPGKNAGCLLKKEKGQYHKSFNNKQAGTGHLIIEEKIPGIKSKAKAKKPKAYEAEEQKIAQVDLKKKRYLSEKGSEDSIQGESKTSITKGSKKHVHKGKGLELILCPYCKKQLTQKIEAHLSKCFEEQHIKQDVPDSERRGNRRINCKADRYSPETYSNRAYNYFKKKEA